MRRFLIYYRLELIALLLFGCATATLAVWNNVKPQNHYVQLGFALVLAAFVIPLYLVMRKNWREKYRAPVIIGIRKAIVGASRFLIKIVGRFSFFHRGNVISGRTTVHYDFSAFRKDQRRRRKTAEKQPRWKDMESPRQRLGFLYYRVISDRIRHGEVITSHETPLEISQRPTEKEAENELFKMYNEVRYDERYEPDEQAVYDLREKLFD